VTKVLVVATSPVAREEISSPIEDRFGEDAEFAVIPIFAGSNRDVTTSHGSDGLELVGGGDGEERTADPAGTIADARRRYGADEVVVVTRVSEEASWVEAGAVESARERLGFPLTHLLVA
jgi:hypothetical protein